MRKRMKIKKRIISIMLCILMVVGLLPMMPEVVQAETIKVEDLIDNNSNVTLTDADSDGYYDISDKDDLIAFSNLVNAGNTTINAELLGDIDMNPGYDFHEDGSYTSGSTTLVTWTPIGTLGNNINNPNDDQCYAGLFNGNGHIIAGLYVNDSSKSYLGLFGAVTSNAKIEKVGVINSYISGGGYLGGITGFQLSGLVVISNCYSDATINGSSNYVGGIAGNNTGRIINCYNTGKVTGTRAQDSIGAIVGSNYSNYTSPIDNCYYLAGTASKGIPGGDSVGVVEQKTAEQFASGEVAYLLNGGCCTEGTINSGVVWYQNLIGDYAQVAPLFAGHGTDVVHCYVNGDTKEYRNHTHDVTYTASGATISASCDDHCAKNFGSVTVKAPTSLIYDGASKEATKDGQLLSNNLSSITVELSYETKDGISMGAYAPSGAGTYRAVISTSVSDGNVKAWVEYTLQPKELSSYTAPTSNNLTYNGTSQELITGGGINESGFTMKYSLDGTNYEEDIPVATDAGTYTVYSKAVGLNQINYETKVFDPITVTIKKAPLTIVAVSTSVTEKDYDGKAEIELSDISLSGIKGADVVGLDISKLTAKLPSADAGDYLKVILSGETVLTGENAANYSIEPVSGEYLLTDRVIVHPIEPEVTEFWRYRDYVYTVEKVETIDLSEFLPADCGPIALSMPEIIGDISVDSFELGDNHTLSYLVPKGEIGDTGTIRLSLRSRNYSEISLTIEVERIDKYEVTPASNVTLKSNVLYVGKALSELEFNPVKFMANGQEIEGTLAWQDATLVPEKGTTSAVWVFTPKDTERYQTLTGKVAIGVYEAPHIQGEDGKQGWDVVLDAVADAKEGDTVKVDMNGTLVVEGDVIEDIKGKDITIVFDMGDGIRWTVKGMDVTADNIADINMGVAVSTPERLFNAIPVAVLNAITGENYHIEINLLHSGEFGFKAVLTLNLEAKNAGLFANLYYYNPQTKELEFICADKIAEDGFTDLAFTHASDYTIVIDDVAADEEESDDSKEPEGTEEPKDSKESGDLNHLENPISPATGEGSGFVIVMMLMILVSGSIWIIGKKRI